MSDDSSDGGGISAKDLCAIIETAHKHKVSTLKFRGLALEFTPKADRQKKVEQVVPAPGDDELPPSEEDLDQLMVEDPVAFEKWHADNGPDGAN